MPGPLTVGLDIDAISFKTMALKSQAVRSQVN